MLGPTPHVTPSTRSRRIGLRGHILGPKRATYSNLRNFKNIYTKHNAEIKLEIIFKTLITAEVILIKYLMKSLR